MQDNDGNEIDASELEDDFDEVEYELGFNQGYTIAELNEDIALELDQAVRPSHSHSNGFVAGIREFFRIRELDNNRESELKQIRGNHDDDRDIER